MKKIIMIRYAELSTKKDNLMFFINSLEKNIREILKDYKFSLLKTKSRIYIDYNDSDEVNIISLLKKVPGITGFSISYSTETDIEAIKVAVAEILKNNNFDTFKVQAKRAYKKFEYDSMEINSIIGEHVLRKYDVKVDVHNPKVTITIEIRDKEKTYVYLDEEKGLGGYPIGTNGRGLLMISGGIDSPVAGYLALKRGLAIDTVYFEAIPHTSINARNKVIELCSKLNNYSGDINLFIVPFGNIQEHIVKNVDKPYVITIMRRMMYRISERLANKLDIKILVNGESLGQVSSQTTSNIYVINSVTNIPIIRPLICLDKTEIISIAKDIKTYDTSILPYEDCCTIFVPDHPVLEPTLEKCEYLEKQFDYEKLIDQCMDKIEKIVISEYSTFEKIL